MSSYGNFIQQSMPRPPSSQRGVQQTPQQKFGGQAAQPIPRYQQPQFANSGYDPQQAASMESLIASSPQQTSQMPFQQQASAQPPAVQQQSIMQQAPSPQAQPAQVNQWDAYEGNKNLQLIQRNNASLTRGARQPNPQSEFALPQQSGHSISPLTNTMSTPTEMNSYRPDNVPFQDVVQGMDQRIAAGQSVIPERGDVAFMGDSPRTGTKLSRTATGGVSAVGDPNRKRIPQIPVRVTRSQLRARRMKQRGDERAMRRYAQTGQEQFQPAPIQTLGPEGGGVTNIVGQQEIGKDAKGNMQYAPIHQGVYGPRGQNTTQSIFNQNTGLPPQGQGGFNGIMQNVIPGQQQQGAAPQQQAPNPYVPRSPVGMLAPFFNWVTGKYDS